MFTSSCEVKHLTGYLIWHVLDIKWFIQHKGGGTKIGEEKGCFDEDQWKLPKIPKRNWCVSLTQDGKEAVEITIKWAQIWEASVRLPLWTVDAMFRPPRKSLLLCGRIHLLRLDNDLSLGRFRLTGLMPQGSICHHDATTQRLLAALHLRMMPALWDFINLKGSSWCMDAALASYLPGLHSCIMTTKGIAH